MDLSSPQALLARLSGVRVPCVGDLMVDRFVYGEVARISPEAPIPMLRAGARSVMLGGGRQCGAQRRLPRRRRPRWSGVVGDDAAGHEALGLARRRRPASRAILVTDPAGATTMKTRFVAAGQQLLRVDHEESEPIDRATARLAASRRVTHACARRGRDPALRLRQGRRHAER